MRIPAAAARICAALFLAVTVAACGGHGAQERTTGEFIDDSAITTNVKTRLAQADEVSFMDVGVQTRQGVVQLTGFVNSTDEARRAVQITQDVEGVRRVENRMSLK